MWFGGTCVCVLVWYMCGMGRWCTCAGVSVHTHVCGYVFVIASADVCVSTCMWL